VALDASHWIRSVARRYCELEADEQRMIAQDAGGEAQGCPMLAKDRCMHPQVESRPTRR
jgi:hypothetical protein